MFQEYTEASYSVKIYIAGPIDLIHQSCRKFVNRTRICVNVTPNHYIFPYGEQPGAIIELIQYPKYPAQNEDIFLTAIELGYAICEECHQGSFTITDRNISKTFDRR